MSVPLYLSIKEQFVIRGWELLHWIPPPLSPDMLPVNMPLNMVGEELIQKIPAPKIVAEFSIKVQLVIVGEDFSLQ